jgi:hypothetical protein
LEDVEILLEVMPRLRGRWILATDPGPLSRYAYHYDHKGRS